MLYLMGFGQGFLELNLTLNQKDIDIYGLTIVQEFIHSIVKVGNRVEIDKRHPSPLRWQSDYLNDSEDFISHATSIYQIFQSLLNQRMHAPTVIIKQPLETSRFFSYAALNVDNLGELMDFHTLKSISHSLAFRQTIDYQSNLDNHNDFFIPFDNIIHCMSIEGGASVIANKENNTVGHLRNFINDTLKKAYYPLVLISYIEYNYLLYLTASFSYQTSNQQNHEIYSASLEALQKKILDFRLYYRFSQGSNLTQHNCFFTKWRNTLGNDLLSQELYEDISQINTFLSYQSEKKLEDLNFRRDKTLGIWGIAATTFIATIGVFGMNMKPFNDFKYSDPLTLGTIIIAFILAVIAILIYIYILQKNRLPSLQIAKN